MARLGTASAVLLLALAPVSAQVPSVAGQDVAAYLPVTIQAVPRIEGISFMLGGKRLRTDQNGLAFTRLRRPGTHNLSTPDFQQVEPGVRAQFVHWSDGDFASTRKLSVTTFTSLEAGFDLSYSTRLNFLSRTGRSIPAALVESATISDDQGTGYSLAAEGPQWLPGVRVVKRGTDLRPQEVSLALDAVVVDGRDRLAPGQPRFRPSLQRPWDISLEGSFPASQPAAAGAVQAPGPGHQVVFEVRDALLGFATGSAVKIQGPDGRTSRHELGPGARVAIDAAGAGDFRATALGPGISFAQRFDPSRAELVRLSVITYLDVAIGVLTLVLIAAGIAALVRRIGSPRPRRGALLDRSRPWLSNAAAQEPAASGPAPDVVEPATPPQVPEDPPIPAPEAASAEEARSRAVAMASEAETALTEARERAREIVSEAENSLAQARKRAREIVQKGIEEAERRSAELRAQAETALAEAREQAVEIMGEAARDARNLRELAEREAAELLRHALRRRNEIQEGSSDVTSLDEVAVSDSEEAPAPARPGVTIKISDVSLLEEQVEATPRSTP